MPGGSVYKDHTFNNETAHLTKTAHSIARIFTVQVHEHYKTQQKTENTEENKMNTQNYRTSRASFISYRHRRES
jgi:hypothetical protein